MKAQAVFYLIIVALAVGIAFFNKDIVFAFGYLTMLIPMFAISSIAYDAFEDGHTFLLTLPVSRREYVLEKYVFAILLEGISLLLAVLLSIGISAILGGGDDLILPLADLSFTTPLIGATVMTILAVMIPVNLKYGAEKSRLALMILVGGIVLLFAFGEQIAARFGFPSAKLTILVEKLERLGAGMVIAAALAVSAAVLALSVTISIRIMEKKEF